MRKWRAIYRGLTKAACRLGAGVVRKKLGLNLVSEQTAKGRIYRIKDGKASPAAADRAKQAA